MVTPAPGAPPVTPGMPSAPMIKSGEKAPSEPPPFKPYQAILWSGAGSVAIELDVTSDISAALAGYFLATRHYPNVHSLGVWKKNGPNADNVVDPPLLYLALVGLDTECSPTISQLTGAAAAAPPEVGTGEKKTTPGAIPLKTTEQGFEEMAKQLKDAQQRKKP